MTVFLGIRVSVTWLAHNKCLFPFPTYKIKLLKQMICAALTCFCAVIWLPTPTFSPGAMNDTPLGSFPPQPPCVLCKVCYETVVPHLPS